MFKSVYAYIDELEQRERQIKKHKKKIKELEKVYNEQVALHNEDIRMHEYNQNYIYYMAVYAELDTILEKFAQELEVQKENLKLEFTTNYDFSTSNKEFAKSVIKQFNSEHYGGTKEVGIKICITNEVDGSKHILSTNVELAEAQKDGTEFGKHLTLIETTNYKGVVDCRLILNETKDIVLPFKFGYLIKSNGNGKYEPKNAMSRAVLLAVEDMRNKQNESLAKININSEME